MNGIPFTHPIITEQAGKVVFEDLVRRGVSINQEDRRCSPV